MAVEREHAGQDSPFLSVVLLVLDRVAVHGLVVPDLPGLPRLSGRVVVQSG